MTLKLYRTAFICLETSLLFSTCSQEMSEITPKYPEAVVFSSEHETWVMPSGGK